MSDLAAPFDTHRDVVRPEWIDHNGHMNVGYYLVVFDFATDDFMAWIGLDGAHRREHDVTTFCLEAHVTYHREVRNGDPLRFTTVLLGHDAKRLHYIHAMYHATEGFLASTNELMSLHVSQATRRAAPMAASVLARLAAIQAAARRAVRGRPRPGAASACRPSRPLARDAAEAPPRRGSVAACPAFSAWQALAGGAMIRAPWPTTPSAGYPPSTSPPRSPARKSRRWKSSMRCSIASSV